MPNTTEELRRLAADMGLEFLPAIPDAALDPALVGDLPVEWARERLLLPVNLDGRLCVVTSNPDDIEGQEYLELLLGEDLNPIAVPGEVIAAAIESCYFSKEDSADEFLRGLEEPGPGKAGIGDASDDLLRVAEKAPVTQLVNLLLLEAVKKGASDIHFEPFEKRLSVRYRVDGVLYEQSSPPKHVEEALVSRLKVMAHMDISERRLPQDGMARVRVGEREIDIRVSTVPVAAGERLVLRLLDKDSSLLPLTSLGMSEDTFADFDAMLKEPNGIVAVCGPTGSGKTTTLYAALGRLDSARRNILTIEDPIEYRLDSIGQIQVRPKIGLTFANGLRHILRQDPDVILVGEIRDAETAEIALRASLTGHLVFTTLHTNDSAGAVVRLLDMGVEPYLLASCLKGIIAQRLVRRLCPQCSSEATPTDAEVSFAERYGLDIRGKHLRRPVGCKSCLDGYRGRVGIFELLPVSGEIQSALRKGGLGLEDVRQSGVRSGMVPLAKDGIKRALDGVTSLDEVLSVTPHA